MDADPGAEREARRAAFGVALDQALRSRGLTLEAVARRLQEAGVSVSVATLSYWRRGQAMPTRATSVEAVRALERVLGLAGGTLVQHVRAETGWFPEQLVESTTVAEMLAELGLNTHRRFRCLAAAAELVLNTDRSSGTVRMRQHMRVLGDDEQAMVLVMGDQDGEVPELIGVSGCRIERVRTDERRGLAVAALDLPRPMRRGEQFWVEYHARVGPLPTPRPLHTWVSAERCPLLSLDVVFTGELPRWAGYRCEPVDEDPLPVREVPLAGDRAQVVISDAAPGEHHLVWEW